MDRAYANLRKELRRVVHMAKAFEKRSTLITIIRNKIICDSLHLYIDVKKENKVVKEMLDYFNGLGFEKEIENNEIVFRKEYDEEKEYDTSYTILIRFC